MAKKKQIKGEEVKKKLSTKTVYHYIDTENNLDVISREVFTGTNKVVHYPFRPDGSPKYYSLKKITYENMPKTLPAGFIKSAGRGYGFTRELNPLLYALTDNYPSVEHVIVSNNGDSVFKNRTTVVFSYDDLSEARPKISALLAEQKNEKEVLSNNILADIFPGKFEAEKLAYQKGMLNNLISQYSMKTDMLSQADINSLSTLISDIPAEHFFRKERGVLGLKESFDRMYLEDILERYETLLSRKSETSRLEDEWQEFFADNILYFNFGYVERFEKEKIQGDKALNIPDFIMLNTYGYLDVIEIKTHLTQLLTYDKGRKNFFWTSEASKAIAQAENYIDSISKHSEEIIVNIRDEYEIHGVNAVRPSVYVIASSKPAIAGKDTNTKYRGGQKVKLWNDFKRLNNALKNVSFILYDELSEMFENMINKLRATQE